MYIYIYMCACIYIYIYMFLHIRPRTAGRWTWRTKQFLISFRFAYRFPCPSACRPASRSAEGRVKPYQGSSNPTAPNHHILNPPKPFAVPNLNPLCLHTKKCIVLCLNYGNP